MLYHLSAILVLIVHLAFVVLVLFGATPEPPHP